jgi:kynureninase
VTDPRDAADPLRALRARFRLPHQPDGTPYIYLCGNSLGPQPIAAAQSVQDVLDDWAELAVLGHHQGARQWMPYHEQFAAPLARLAGAQAAEVVAMNTLTVNLHLLLVSFYRPTPARSRILCERGAFPSDRYALVTQARFHGYDPAATLIEIEPRPDTGLLATADIAAAIERDGPRIALVLLPGVQYLTGQVLDMARITAQARRQGCVVGWDLAHAIGNVPLSLHDWGADFAVWCSYKYLCGGPGAIAGAFVHERHAQARELPRFAGWWGHNKQTRFEMGPDFEPIPGAEGWQLSNPPVLALAPLLGALATYDRAGMPAVREKSLAQGQYARELLAARLETRVRCLTPDAPAERGCQLSLKIDGDAEHGRRVFEQLKRLGVIGDWREPNVIRIAPHPLYNSYAEVAQFVDCLTRAVSVS